MKRIVLDTKKSPLSSVAVGGELCLTSGDRREPEESEPYNPSSP